MTINVNPELREVLLQFEAKLRKRISNVVRPVLDKKTAGP
jgi:hypothetical protein